MEFFSLVEKSASFPAFFVITANSFYRNRSRVGRFPPTITIKNGIITTTVKELYICDFQRKYLVHEVAIRKDAVVEGEDKVQRLNSWETAVKWKIRYVLTYV